MKNWLRKLIIIAVIILCCVTVGIIKHQQSTITALSIIKSDNVTNKQPDFFHQSPKEGLKEALSYYDLHHKDIVYAQAILETGHFTSNVCVRYNNLFGLYNSKEGKYYQFKHWTESVVAYKNWIQKKYSFPNDYYDFLISINYAEDKEYVRKVKRIAKGTE